MKFKIAHRTEYLFSSEVFLEPHYLRFRPTATSFLDIAGFSLNILPKPAGHKVITDEENNVLDFCWFDGMTARLNITSESILETRPFNPFDFIVHPHSFNTVPFRYSEAQKKLLFATLERQSISKGLTDYGTAILKTSNYGTIPYLTNLTNRIHEDFTVVYREDGPPLHPDETFERKSGSCRDLAWMQINLLRQQGFASGFVSGYYYFEMEHPVYELHAWVAVFLPGTGWLGLDPSHGILTGNTHFPIASSAYPESTMPVSGDIRGSATSKLATELTIEKL